MGRAQARIIQRVPTIIPLWFQQYQNNITWLLPSKLAFVGYQDLILEIIRVELYTYCA